MPDIDGKHVRLFESSQLEGSYRELIVYVLNIFFFRFFSIVDDCKVWTVVPCAVYWWGFASLFSVPFFLWHVYILNFNWNNTKGTNSGIAKACFSVLWLVLWKHTKMTPYTVVVQSLSHVWLFVTPRTSCPSLSPRVCSNSCPLSQWCYPTISSSVTPISSCPQSFPASRSLSSELAVRIRWPKYWSFSFSPFNEYSVLISFRID